MVDTLNGAHELTNLNHIIYFGVKLTDVKTQPGLRNNDSYVSLILFPEDISSITKECATSCLHLLSTNKSIFGDRERVSIEFHNFSVAEDIKDIIIPKLEEIANTKGKAK